MNLDSLNKWLTLAANLGVIAGIVFLTLEINQTNRIANAQFLADELETRTSAFDARIADDLPGAWSKAVANDPDITDKELILIDAFLSREWTRSLHVVIAEGYGFASSPVSARANEWAFQYLGNKVARKWWQQRHEGLLTYNIELRDEIDVVLKNQGDAFENWQYSNIQKIRETLR